MTDDKVTLTFIHPTNPSETLTAAVSTAATPHYLVEQMITAGFLVPAAGAGQYKLRNNQTGIQLVDNTTLKAAGIDDGTEILVDHTVTGASARR